ncbi:MAG: GNAT family N-acetyltransferase [Pseudoclavibacter sp.]
MPIGDAELDDYVERIDELLRKLEFDVRAHYGITHTRLPYTLDVSLGFATHWGMDVPLRLIVHDIVLEPTWRGRGIGSWLLGSVCQFADERNLPVHLRMSTFQGEEAVRAIARLDARHGFTGDGPPEGWENGAELRRPPDTARARALAETWQEWERLPWQPVFPAAGRAERAFEQSTAQRSASSSASGKRTGGVGASRRARAVRRGPARRTAPFRAAHPVTRCPYRPACVERAPRRLDDPRPHLARALRRHPFHS